MASIETIRLADAKARLSELIERAESGETVCITKRGKPVAKLIRIPAPRKPVDVEMLRKHTAGMTLQTESARAFGRRMRDEDRY